MSITQKLLKEAALVKSIREDYEYETAVGNINPKQLSLAEYIEIKRSDI